MIGNITNVSVIPVLSSVSWTLKLSVASSIVAGVAAMLNYFYKKRMAYYRSREVTKQRPGGETHISFEFGVKEVTDDMIEIWGKDVNQKKFPQFVEDNKAKYGRTYTALSGTIESRDGSIAFNVKEAYLFIDRNGKVNKDFDYENILSTYPSDKNLGSMGPWFPAITTMNPIFEDVRRILVRLTWKDHYENGYCKCCLYARREGERELIKLTSFGGNYLYTGYKPYPKRKEWEKCSICYYDRFKKELKKHKEIGMAKPND